MISAGLPTKDSRSAAADGATCQRNTRAALGPLMILYFVAQRYMVAGMTAGSVKG